MEAQKKPQQENSPVSKKEEGAVDYLDSFPPGYRFCPLDEELILCYLNNKVLGLPLPYNRITEVNLYSYNPERLAELHEHYGEKEWYFFTPREKKYPNGSRPNRSAGDGYWKATGADREIKVDGCVVGYRKALVFYKGKAPKGDKTSWIMHEYRVHDPPSPKKDKGSNDMRLDDYVLCRVYKKADTKLVTTETKIEDPSPSLPLIRNEDTQILASGDMMNCSMTENFTNQMFHEETFQRMFGETLPPLHFPTKNIYDRFGADADDVIWSQYFVDNYHSPLDLSPDISKVVSQKFKEEESTKEYQRQFYEIQKK